MLMVGNGRLLTWIKGGRKVGGQESGDSRPQRQAGTPKDAKKQKARAQGPGFLLCRSLALTYFRIRTHTIIGAAPFHCPVRDGKEWFQSAMGTRHNLSLRRSRGEANSEEVGWDCKA